MTKSEEAFELREVEGALHITFLEESLTSRDALDAMFEVFHAMLAEREKPRVVFNFTHVSNLSSVFIGKLMALQKRIRQQEGRLKIVEVNQQAYEILSLTRVIEQISVKRSATAGNPVIPHPTAPPPSASVPLRNRAAWSTMAGTTVVAAMVGIYILIRTGLQGREGASLAAAAFFIFCIPVALLIVIFRQQIHRLSPVTQWAVACAMVVLTVVCLTLLALNG